jgi:Lrp/AsnC family transcriptional regulator for asnA, asnC and gidA
MNQLSIKDRKILYYLDLNSRQSYSIIGKRTGVHKNSVQYRINLMEKSGIINGYYSIIDSFKLDYEVLKIYFNFQYTTPKIEKDIITHFSNSKFIWALYTVNGWFDLDAILWVKDRYQFFNFWEKTLLKYGDFFKDITLSFYIRLNAFRADYLLTDIQQNISRNSSTLTGEKTKIDIDKLDFDILSLIAPNARISLTEISEILGQPRSLIKSRFNRLVKQKVIQGFRVKLDISKIGYVFFKVDIQLKEYSKRNKIIKYISKNPHLVAIDETIGVSHIELELHLHNDEELHQIMNDITTKFPDAIRSYRFIRIKKLHKLSYFPSY